MVRFREVQKFRQWWLRVLLMAVALGLIAVFGYGMITQLVLGHTWGNRPLSDTALSIVGPLMILMGIGLVWLNVTGSGNEISAHVQENPRMTIMFASFEDNPMILRLYGNARVLHEDDPEWGETITLFRPLPGARQIFDLAVDLVQTSCGMAVPFFDYAGEREQLNEWAVRKGEAGLRAYRAEKNRISLDGRPIRISDNDS